MAKKKLTRTQVGTQVNKIQSALEKLFSDKLAYGSNSFVPYSVDKLLDLVKKTSRVAFVGRKIGR